MVDPMFTLIVSVHKIVSVHTRVTGKFMMIDSILSEVVCVLRDKLVCLNEFT